MKKELRFQLRTMVWWLPVTDAVVYFVGRYHVGNMAAFVIGGMTGIILLRFDDMMRERLFK